LLEKTFSGDERLKFRDLLATILLDMGRGNLSDDDGVQVFKAHRPDAVPRLHEWPFTEHV